MAGKGHKWALEEDVHLPQEEKLEIDELPM